MLCLISMFIHRPVDNISLIQNVIYYTPVYLIRILVSIYKEKLYSCLKNKEIFLILAFVGLVLYQSYIGDIGNYHKNAFNYDGVDIVFFQKLFTCFFFLIFLHRFEGFNNKIVNLVAATSFTSFFIHPYILLILSQVNLKFFRVDSWLIYCLFVLLLLCACIVIALTIKKSCQDIVGTLLVINFYYINLNYYFGVRSLINGCVKSPDLPPSTSLKAYVGIYYQFLYVV
ncbi:MAG: peptidoglycan/LPS O-acetylase OafA/YrhL [Cognaticolwellia sp.]